MLKNMAWRYTANTEDTWRKKYPRNERSLKN